MRRVAPLAALLVLALLSPSALAKGEPVYPPEFVALLPGWTQEAEALATPADRERPWWPEAETFLARAKEASAEGRLRVAMFHLETFTELVIAHQLHDEANQTRTSDAERRTLITTRTSAMRQDAESDWMRFRSELHGYDGELRSLQTIEKALYAADIALAAMLAMTDYDPVARDLVKQSGVPFGYTLALVRSSHTASLNIGWAQDILAEAVKQEGLPPRVIDERWDLLTAAALQEPTGEAPAHLSALDAAAKPARQNNETLLAVTAKLAEQRTQRAYGMQTMFGDGGSRGLDVVGDATRGMRKALENTSMETPPKVGLVGVFTADAIDRALLTDAIAKEGVADLGTVVVAWSGLDHQNYVLATLAQASPVRPPEEAPANETPAGGMALVVAALAVALLARRRA